jgi:hypothetical protein
MNQDGMKQVSGMDELWIKYEHSMDVERVRQEGSLQISTGL